MKNILLFLAIFTSTNYSAPLIGAKTFADKVLICDSRGAKVYHSYECRGLANCKHKVLTVTKSEAVKMGRRACKICY